ncbi:MAG: YdbH domain-containing protein, partial [Proteobacteria bacterium]|nr:YdbH domain-containing protein [Pseudomonadota bacterium]
LVLNDDATLPIAATLRISLAAGPLKLGTIAIGRSKLSAALKIAVAETTRVDVSPDLLMELTGIESPAFSIASVSATQFSGMQLAFDKGEWSGDIDHLQLAFDSLTDREGLLASVPILFAGVHLSNSAATIEAQVSISPGAAALSWDNTGILVPGIDGRVSLQNNRVTASLLLADKDGAVTASVDVLHNLTTGAGSISVTDAMLQFGRRKLSGHFLEWSHAWDIVAGSWTTDIEMDWYTGNDPITYSGTMAHRARVLAGNYNDYVFSGLNTTLTGNLDSATGVTLLPSSIELELFDVGLPLKQITADFELDIEQQALGVQNLSMSVLGGKLLVDPFRFDLREERNDLVLRPQSIQLQFMAELAELESIELSGSLSGVLPVTILNDNVTIVDGRLENDPPGGVIRYLSGAAAEGAADADSGIGLVSRALGNFQFDSLTADVNYTENGDLMLQMRLTGVNPDMDANQPVILNLGVENNIPQLLRSLRATRSIEEILERMSGNQAR